MRATTGQLFDEINRGTIYPVYLLLGEDQGAKEEFLSRLRSAHFEGSTGEQEDVSVFHGDEASVGAILEALSTFSFFSEKKLVIVKDFDKLTGSRHLAEYIERLPISSSSEGRAAAGALLALLTGKKNAEKSLEHAVEKKGRSCIFWPMFDNEGERWIMQKLRDQGIRTDRETLRYIIDVTGTALSDLANQIEIISNLLDRGEDLTLETAKSALSQIYSYTVFDLTGALFVKKSAEILKIFRHLVGNGEDLLKIEYFLSREVRKILDASSMKESGYQFSRIVELLGLKKREAARIGMIVESVSIPYLRALCANIAALDYLIKTSPKELCLIHFERLLLGLGRRKE